MTDILKIQDFFRLDPQTQIILPLVLEQTSAGFPSPAENFVEARIDLNVELVKHPAATFLARNGKSSDSMINAGILPNSMVIIDRDLETRHGNIVIARLEDKFTVKRLSLVGNKIRLLSENDNYPPIEVITADFEIWGRVTHVITKL